MPGLPGAVGTLQATSVTFASGASYLITINGASNSKLTATGAATLNSGAHVNIAAGSTINVNQTYTILTVGEGLVTAIPALLVSMSGGLITTRAASESDLGEEVAVVEVTDATFRTLMLQWPFPRCNVAEVISQIAKAHPKAIAIDIQYTEPSKAVNAEHISCDQVITSAIADAVVDEIRIHTTASAVAVNARAPLVADAQIFIQPRVVLAGIQRRDD